MGKPITAVKLLVKFLLAVVISGIDTVRVILHSSLISHAPPPAAFIRIRFAPMNAQGATLLGCMITLTPGTTTIDIDMQRREMLLHLLDATDPEAAVDGIRKSFEPSLLVLFGLKPDMHGEFR